MTVSLQHSIRGPLCDQSTQQHSTDGALPLQGILEVLATDGDSELGGDDFDRAVARWALDACRGKGHAAG